MKIFKNQLIAPLSIVTMTTILAVGFGVANAENNDEKKTSENSEMGMKCPMMAGMKGVSLHADSPPLLIAQADNLKLTAEQKQKIQEIAESARQQAREILNDEQRKSLENAPEGPLSPMQIAKMRMKDKMNKGESKMMCPMCMKMMKKKMQKEDETKEE